jgi:hypothetical protein
VLGVGTGGSTGAASPGPKRKLLPVDPLRSSLAGTFLEAPRLRLEYSGVWGVAAAAAATAAEASAGAGVSTSRFDRLLDLLGMGFFLRLESRAGISRRLSVILSVMMVVLGSSLMAVSARKGSPRFGLRMELALRFFSSSFSRRRSREPMYMRPL